MRDFSQLKVCFVAGTLEHGGAERQLFYMLQALCRRGAAPRVLCLDQGEFWEASIKSLGVPVSWVGQSKSRLARLRQVLKELRADPPDVLQSQHFFANAYVGLSARFLGLTGIGALRNEADYERQGNSSVGSWLNFHASRFIAANSRLAIRQTVERGLPASRLHFLPNVVDTECFKPAEISAERPLTLLAVGRIVKTKRFDRFISVVARLRTELKLNVRARIVGPTQDENLRKELEAQSDRLGLSGGVLEFLGGVSDMGPLYQQADVCVLTSDFEGTPNVLLEAMASGLPVVATNVGGVTDIVQHDTTGFVVNRDDGYGLLAALAKLARNSSQRLEMGRHARKFIETNHSLERLPVYLENLYDLVLPSRCSWKARVIERAAV